jgi:glyoxylase-like metal-dependent hydrolase (beta-lactamase superfamily II)
MQPEVTAFFDNETFTVTYVVREPGGKVCAIIDPVLDYDPAAGRTSTQSADRVLSFIDEKQLEVAWILETHAHADHLSAAAYLKSRAGGLTGTGSSITDVQASFKKIYNLGDEFQPDGRQFDGLFDDGDLLDLGDASIKVLHTPGHTSSCVTYLFGDTAFVGDTLFMPDYGTARTDFPGGDAAQLYRSIHRLFELPDETRVFLCHDYRAPGRDEYRWETTIGDQRKNNIHIHEGVSEQEFVEFRRSRDARLGMPKLILPSIQVNIRGGQMPPAEDNGTAYLKIPVNAF